VVQAVAKHDQTLGTTKSVTFTALYRQGAPNNGPPQVTPPQPPSSSGNSSGAGFGTIALVAAGVGVAGGLGYAWWKRRKKRR
jgi:LPXTG-motif cell wall-anchored protein